MAWTKERHVKALETTIATRDKSARSKWAQGRAGDGPMFNQSRGDFRMRDNAAEALKKLKGE